jgi:predicted Fe-Mo cluster-binding NifX family protein
MAEKVLIPLYVNDVAPRFDLATEAFIGTIGERGEILEERTIVLPHASCDALCHLILAERVGVVICGGIEEEYYQYLTWKKVLVLDSVIGPYERALDRFRAGHLKAGAILLDRHERLRGV